MTARASLLLALLAAPAAAEVLVPLRPIPAASVLAAEDLGLADAVIPGALSDPALVIGQETRVALYPGRPIRPGDIGPPTLVERNALIPLVYRQGALAIAVEGRALDRAGAGDVLRVMNLASRVTVTARIGPDGSAVVPP